MNECTNDEVPRSTDTNLSSSKLIEERMYTKSMDVFVKTPSLCLSSICDVVDLLPTPVENLAEHENFLTLESSYSTYIHEENNRENIDLVYCQLTNELSSPNINNM